MKQTVYIDVLIIVNMFVNYFLLLATAKILCLKRNSLRIAAADFLGALYSLYIFLPVHSAFVSALIKLAMSLTIVLTAFKTKTIKNFVKTLVCFYSVNFAFSGIMFGIWCVLKPKGMAVNNGVVYFNISPVILVALTLISYALIELINRVAEKKENKNLRCNLRININGKHIDLKAKVDTGNSLKEPFSNLPVVVVRQSGIAQIMPPGYFWDCTRENNSFENFPFKLRMIPYKTILGDGVLPAFKPQSIHIEGGAAKEAYIAVCSDETLTEETSALLNPELLD